MYKRQVGGQQTCIGASSQCDGHSDCDDGEDERCVVPYVGRTETTFHNYTYLLTHCGVGEGKICHNTYTGTSSVLCSINGRQACIPATELCDGYSNCDSGEDEECKFGEDGYCSRWIHLCDGDSMCDDGRDEEQCGNKIEDGDSFLASSYSKRCL